MYFDYTHKYQYILHIENLYGKTVKSVSKEPHTAREIRGLHVK